MAVFTSRARTISGVVLAESDTTAVVGAVCRLSADGKFLAGAETNSKGQFQVETDSKERLSLEIGFTGYNTTDILIEAGKKDVDLGYVFLNEGIALQEVTVTGNQIIDSRGRTIIYPSVSDVKASSTSLSLFQKLPLPGLEANPINRTISVDGGSPFILINGVPSSMADVNALQPKDILKIEFSRITPARYADRGGNGFLNITLRQRNDGGTVYLWGRSALQTAFVDGSVRASYHQGPSQFVLSYQPSWRNYNKVFDRSDESYIGDDFRVDIESKSKSPFNYLTNWLSFRYNYSPNLKTLFSATFNADPGSDKRRSHGSQTDSELGSYDFYNIQRGSDFSPSLDLFLRHDFNSKNSLEVDVVGTLSYSKYKRENTYYFDTDDNIYSVDVNSHRRSLITEVSYNHYFSEKTSLAAGVQNTISYSRNKYLNTDYRPVLTENNNYAYVRLGQQVGRVWFSVATGMKMYWIDNADNKRHFIRNLSQAQLSWTPSQVWNLSASFNYSPGIPSLSSLTDYAQQISPYLISNGNPDLKSTQSFNYVVTPRFQYKKISASLQMYYGETLKTRIGDVRYMGEGMFLSQTVNSKKTWTTGFYLNLKISEIYGFGANLGLQFNHYETLLTDHTYHISAWEPTIMVWYSNGPFTVSYWRKFPGKYLSGTSCGKNENGDSLAFEWNPNSHWTVGVSWMYMFDKKGTRYPQWNYNVVNPSSSYRYIKNNSNMVCLSVSYNADFGSIFRSARRNLQNSDSGSAILRL